ncbi:MAG: ATP-binding cassette domain-containing protein [Myxococcales bacterium]|nr:ATP-binding cassette domain-containing protein [Myxococcales bacterium]
MIEWRDISLQLGETRLFAGWSARVSKGERVRIRGRSGAGKSTLFQMALGFVEPDAGTVRVAGRPLTDDTVGEIRRQIAWVPQTVELGDGTVRQAFHDVVAFRANQALDASEAQMRALLERLALPSKTFEQPVSQLSGGERQRVAFAIAVLLRREIYLLDEPVAALDPHATAAVRRVLDDLGPETTVAVILHGDDWDDYREIALT